MSIQMIVKTDSAIVFVGDNVYETLGRFFWFRVPATSYRDLVAYLRILNRGAFIAFRGPRPQSS